MLNINEIEEIVELDGVNMRPILEKYSIEYEPIKRKEGIKNELMNGAKFIFLKEAGKIIAYIEYINIDENTIKCPSIQIHPSYKKSFTLVKLLRKIYREMKGNFPEKIISSVHANNLPSLKLHKKLGFEKVKENINTIKLEGSGKGIENYLYSLSKKKDCAHNSYFPVYDHTKN